MRPRAEPTDQQVAAGCAAMPSTATRATASGSSSPTSTWLTGWPPARGLKERQGDLQLARTRTQAT
jgi:hypothetical protein